MKKAEVRKLAKLDTGDGVSSVPGVAASLKASGMRSGDQYLNDLKLLHIEERLELPPWLVRVFSLCKKALLRNRGWFGCSQESAAEKQRTNQKSSRGQVGGRERRDVGEGWG